MLPFGDLYKLLCLCIQTLQQDILCSKCLNGLKFQLVPQLSIETSIFNHPQMEFYQLKHALRKVIQNKIFIINNFIFFGEEMLIRLQNHDCFDLSRPLIELLTALRRARLFPIVEILPYLAPEILQKNNLHLKIFLENRVVKIWKVLQLQSNFATPFLSCCNIDTTIKVLNMQYGSFSISKDFSLPSIDSALPSTCYEHISLKNCSHSQSTSYNFLHLQHGTPKSSSA